MQKKKIITLAGFPGSGKSSTADGVAKELGYKRFSSGDFMRQIALDRNVSLNELSKIAENDTSVDKDIDAAVKKTSEMDNVVIDSRLAFHWIPESFKVYLDLAPEIAQERIFNNLKTNKYRQQSEGQMDAEEVSKKIIERFESEKKRFQNLYNINHADKNNFDLVVDTDKNDLQQVIETIVREYKKWLEN